MVNGSARKVLFFVALVALGTVMGIVLTRPASPHPVYLLNATEATILGSRRYLPQAREARPARPCRHGRPMCRA